MKKIALLMLLCFCIPIFSACNQPTTDNPGDQQQDTAEVKRDLGGIEFIWRQTYPKENIFGFTENSVFADSAIIRRDAIQSSLNCTITVENTEWSQMPALLIAAIATGDHFADIINSADETAKNLMKAGFHVICEKPMTMTVAEALELEKIVAETRLTFALTHTYTGYPMIRQMRDLIAKGVLGTIQRIDAQYYQGWINSIIHGTGSRITGVWRLDPKHAGVSSCMGDIGVHAFNLIEFTTGLEVKEVLSDLNSVKAFPCNFSLAIKTIFSRCLADLKIFQ